MKGIQEVGNAEALVGIVPLVPTLPFGEVEWRERHVGSPHKDTETAYLRSIYGELDYGTVANELLPNTTDLGKKPEWFALMRWVMRELKLASLGRVMFVKLKAGGTVTPHEDSGDYCKRYNRYHIPITTNEHCAVASGADEVVHMEVGKIYELANKQTHSAWNYGVTDRIHLIVDGIPL